MVQRIMIGRCSFVINTPTTHYCGVPTGGGEYCEEHRDLRCDVCGQRADMQCQNKDKVCETFVCMNDPVCSAHP